jgi:hypothetical protein
VRAEPGPGAPETAREVRRRIVRAFIDGRLRLGQREVTIQPAPPDARGPRPSETA